MSVKSDLLLVAATVLVVLVLQADAQGNTHGYRVSPQSPIQCGSGARCKLISASLMSESGTTARSVSSFMVRPGAMSVELGASVGTPKQKLELEPAVWLYPPHSEATSVTSIPEFLTAALSIGVYKGDNGLPDACRAQGAAGFYPPDSKTCIYEKIGWVDTCGEQSNYDGDGYGDGYGCQCTIIGNVAMSMLARCDMETVASQCGLEANMAGMFGYDVVTFGNGNSISNMQLPIQFVSQMSMSLAHGTAQPACRASGGGSPEMCPPGIDGTLIIATLRGDAGLVWELFRQNRISAPTVAFQAKGDKLLLTFGGVAHNMPTDVTKYTWMQTMQLKTTTQNATCNSGGVQTFRIGNIASSTPPATVNWTCPERCCFQGEGHGALVSGVGFPVIVQAVGYIGLPALPAQPVILDTSMPNPQCVINSQVATNIYGANGGPDVCMPASFEGNGEEDSILMPDSSPWLLFTAEVEKVVGVDLDKHLDCLPKCACSPQGFLDGADGFCAKSYCSADSPLSATVPNGCKLGACGICSTKNLKLTSAQYAAMPDITLEMNCVHQTDRLECDPQSIEFGMPCDSTCKFSPSPACTGPAEFTMHPSDYLSLVDGTTNEYQVLVKPISQQGGQTVLGMPFLTKYSAVYQMDPDSSTGFLGLTDYTPPMSTETTAFEDFEESGDGDLTSDSRRHTVANGPIIAAGIVSTLAVAVALIIVVKRLGRPDALDAVAVAPVSNAQAGEIELEVTVNL